VNEILVAVQPYSDVVEGASIDTDTPSAWGMVESCYNCGGLLFYQVTAKVDGTELATDTHVYCAVCGRDNGGIFNDPLDELNLDSKQGDNNE